MPYFKEINTLYLHVPKTGGTSIETFFYNRLKIADRNTDNLYGWYLSKADRIRVPDERTLQHFTYAEITGDQYSSLFPIEIRDPISNTRIIVSVRNPYDRMVSEVFWNKCIPFDRLNPTPEKVEAAIHHFLYVDQSIQDHRRPQFQYILDKTGAPLQNIDIVRCETLTEDMHSLGFTDFQEYENGGTGYTSAQYQALLTDCARNMIEDYYRDDFRHFGYTFHLNPVSEEPTPVSKENSYKATIVTAFISGVNKASDRPMDIYIEFGRKLLAIPVPIVCFIEADVYAAHFEKCLNQFPHTTFIITKKSDLYLYNYRDAITQFSLNTPNTDKNTIEYLFVQCNKTEWVREAIDRNIYKTEQYIWVDFGIYHMIRDEAKMHEAILAMALKEYDDLRIASCKYKGYTVPYDVYHTITWTFAGSVFGGGTDSLLRFAYLTKSEILKTIREKKSLMWEINIWYLIYLKHPEFMNFYTTGHDLRILNTY